jgi:hypothetical protein
MFDRPVHYIRNFQAALTRYQPSNQGVAEAIRNLQGPANACNSFYQQYNFGKLD